MWNKKGQIIVPNTKLWWNRSHGMLPTAVYVEEDEFCIYYSGRDDQGRSQIGMSLITVTDGAIEEIVRSKVPVLTSGERGCFDDNGVTPSCVVEDKLYYIGWNSGTTTYRMSLIMGLAKFNDGVFERQSRAPLMPRTNKEPFGICTAPFVLKEDVYKMWYVSGEGWINKDLPKYNIKYATSKNGIRWNRKGTVSLDLLENETALARPCVLKTEDGYEMFFSYKDPEVGYRVGYATSVDGIKFERQIGSEYELSTSDTGWDSEMVEYSYVFDHKGTRYMLYNGNGYGQNGIGYAVWE